MPGISLELAKVSCVLFFFFFLAFRGGESGCRHITGPGPLVHHQDPRSKTPRNDVQYWLGISCGLIAPICPSILGPNLINPALVVTYLATHGPDWPDCQTGPACSSVT